ncbi:MAG: heme-binding protein, partial [Stellaceae bacterium]
PAIHPLNETLHPIPRKPQQNHIMRGPFHTAWTQTLEAAINTGRPAAITAERIQMQGGVPIHIGGTVVGAVGVSGFDKTNDVEIAETAAAAVK